VAVRERKQASPIQRESAQTQESAAHFSCPRDGCICVFHTSTELEQHLSFESCLKEMERKTMLDIAKEEYALLLKEDSTKVPSLRASSQQGISNLQEGWSLKESKKAYRFNANQKQYLDQKFNIGQSTGRKVDADVVTKEMRRARGLDGERLFRVTEFLAPDQVASYFSRLAVKARQVEVPVTEQDVRAAVEASNFNAAREDILSSLQLSHPIVCDQFNLCDMVKQDTLKGLKVVMLQTLCEQLSLDVPHPPIKRKAPYLSLLENTVKCCCCSV